MRSSRMVRAAAAAALVWVTAAAPAALASPTAAAGDDLPAIARMMLTDGDVGGDFVPDAPLSGPLDDNRAKAVGMPFDPFGPRVDTWQRVWHAPTRGLDVAELGVDGPDRSMADGLVEGVRKAAPQNAFLTLSSAPSVLAYAGTDPATGLLVMRAVPTRGRLAFILTVVSARSARASATHLLDALVARQLGKLPSDIPDIEPADAWRTEAAGGTVGAVIGYVLLLDVIARFRDPLRRRARPRPSPATAGSPGVVVRDVSSVARTIRRHDAGRVAVSFAGLGVLAYGNPFQEPHWPLYVAVGVALLWAAQRYRVVGLRGRQRWAVPRYRRTPVVVAMIVVATALAAAGFVTVMTGALGNVEEQYVRTGTDYSGAVLGAGAVLLALAAVCLRWAHRRGLYDARTLLHRDRRPPVLYLRSFDDDDCRVRTATLGRPSFLESLSPRRFDAFEEVVVRSLSEVGPVVALNPPDVRRPPLGAARQSLASHEWQSVIGDWVGRAALVVVTLPPRTVSDGLRWELASLSTAGQWGKVVVVVPAVPRDELRERWERMAAPDAAAHLFPSVLDDLLPDALAVAWRGGTWTVATADRRSEQTYYAALSAVRSDCDPSDRAGERSSAHHGTRRRVALTVTAAAVLVGLPLVAWSLGRSLQDPAATAAVTVALPTARPSGHTPATSSGAASPSARETSDPAQEVLATFDSLLSLSASARADVVAVSGAVQACSGDLRGAGARLRAAAELRRRLAATAEAIPAAEVAALRDGTRLMLSFVTAQETSAGADDDYAAWADDVAAVGCTTSAPHDAHWVAAGVLSNRATQAKATFASLWNPLAGATGRAAVDAGNL